ncbi:MAG: hypothetical protein C0522_12535 [Rhodocyclaceae bacterium]|jgi:hypothetical protein|nr:hypothetical protein [Rhodocyclaceae bacterium]
MTSLTHPAVWLLAAATAALNLPLGRLRAHAPRRSHRWFGLLAALVFLFLALRHAFALDWIAALAAGLLLFIGAPAMANMNKWDRLDFVHNTVFVLIDGKGRLRTEFHGLATPTEEIAKAARVLMTPQAAKKRK